MKNGLNCGTNAKGKKQGSSSRSSKIQEPKGGEKLINEIMKNPRKVLDSIKFKPKKGLPKLERLKKKIEKKYRSSKILPMFENHPATLNIGAQELIAIAGA